MKIEPTPARRRALRAEAHHLDPVVMIGNEGLTPAVLHEIDLNLLAHGLIKVRVFSDDRAVRDGFMARIADELEAAPIQHIGKLLVLYRPIPEPEETETAPVRARKRPGIADPRTLRRSTGGSHRGNHPVDNRRRKAMEAAAERRKPAAAATGSGRRKPGEPEARSSSRSRPVTGATGARRTANGTATATAAGRGRKTAAAPTSGAGTRRRRTSQP